MTRSKKLDLLSIKAFEIPLKILSRDTKNYDLVFSSVSFSSINLQIFVNLEKNLHVQIQYVC